MSAFLFGDCGCCRRSLSPEWQAVVAEVPYMMGWLPRNPNQHRGYETSSYVEVNRGDQVLPITVPGAVFLRHRGEIIAKSTGLVARTYIEYFTRTGVYVPPPSFPPLPPDPIGYKYVDYLEDPYTYSQAATAAVSLLGYVGFDGAVNVSFPDGTDWGVPAAVRLCHLCYPSDAWKWPESYQALYVTFHPLTGAVVVASANQSHNSSGVALPSYVPSGVVPGLGFCANGTMGGAPTSGVGAAPVWNGYVSACKTANRTPVGFKSKQSSHLLLDNNAWQTWVFDGNPPTASPLLIEPENYLPGEHIFDPTDAPYQGSANFMAAAAPVLGG